MENDIGIKIGLEGVAAYNASLKQVEGKTTTSMRGVGSSVDSASTSFKQLATQIPGVGTAIALLSNPIGAVIASAAALTGIFTSFVGTAAKFESQLATVGALAGLDQSTEGFKALNEEAKRLGATTEFSATQAAQAMEFLVRAGFDATETLAGTADTLSLATVGALDLARASDIATDTLSQFQLPVEELGRVVDVISKTTVTANTNVTQFADAMNYLGPTAQALGISLEESSAAIGILSSSGLKGSLATRALGTSLVRLTKPTAEAAATLEKFNIEAFNDQGEFVGLAGLVGQLETAFSGLTQEQEQAALAAIFGAEAIQEINILLGKGSKELARYTSEIEEAGKQNGQFAQGIRDIKLDTFEGAVIQIKSAFEALKIELTDGSLPVLKDLALLFADALRGTVSLVGELGNIGPILTDNAAVITLAATAFAAYNSAAIVSAFTAVPGLIKSVFILSDTQKKATIIQGAYTAVTTAFNGLVGILTGKIKLLTVAQRALNFVQSANPLGLIITALGLAGAAYLTFNKETRKAVGIAKEERDVRGEVVKAIGGEVSSLQTLFAPLTRENTSRKDKKDAIDAINRQYGPLLSNMLTEKSSAEDIAKAYQEITRQIVLKQVAQQREAELNALVASAVEFEKNREQQIIATNKAREEANRLVADEVEQNRELGSQLEFLAGLEENLLENTTEITQRNADNINAKYDNLVDSIVDNLSGLDLGFLSKDVTEIGGAADSAGEKIKTLADQLSELGVSLPAFEEFEGLTELSDQTDEVKQKANEARDAIVQLGEEPNASVSVLKDQISDLRQAISLLPPEAAGIKAITDEVVRLELQLLEAERQIEKTFLATKIDAVEFEVIAKVTDFDIPTPDPVEIPVDFVPITNPFTSLEGAAEVLGTDVDFLNDRFRDTGELLDLMDTNSFKFFSKFLEDIEDGIDFTLLWREALLQIGKEVLFQVGDAFEVLGQGIGSALATPIETTEVLREKLAAINTALATVPPDSGVAESLNQQKEAIEAQLDSAGALRSQYEALKLSMESLPKDSEAFKVMEDQAKSLEKQLGLLEGTTGRFSTAFSSFVDALLETVLVSVPKMLGLFFLQAAVATSFPAGVPFAIAGLALVGLSGLAKGLLSQNEEIQDTVLGGFSAPNLESSAVPTGPSLATGQQSAFGLSDLNQDQGQVTNVTVMFGPEDVTDFFSIAFQTEKELTG